MSLLRPLIAVLVVGGCYQEYQQPTTPQPYFEAQPIMVQGPPGGGMDPESADLGNGAAGGVTATVDVTATVTDAEIDSTLEGYGMWVEDEEYGRIWRPDATVVGVDFTPYETCGTWVWTEYGWTYSCDWDWGWLPFHYGNWGWFDDYWAWVPDYTYSPAWVEWRNGGGYTGWRPIGPGIRDHRDHSNPSRGPIVRDHRNQDSKGPIIRDHRGIRTGDADWRFVADRDLGRRIRPTLVRNNAEGIRATSVVSRPAMGPSPHARAHLTRASDLMQHRLTARNPVRGGGSVGTVGTSRPTYTPPTYGNPRPYRPRPSTYNPTRPAPATGMQPLPTYDTTPQPTYTQPSQPTYPSTESPTRPSYDGTPNPTRPTYDRPTYQPSRPTYQPSQPSRPSFNRPTYTPSRPTYTPSTPSRPTYTPSAPSAPSRPSSSAPSRSWGSSSPSRASSSSSSSSSSSPSRAPSSSSSSSSSSGRGSHRR